MEAEATVAGVTRYERSDFVGAHSNVPELRTARIVAIVLVVVLAVLAFHVGGEILRGETAGAITVGAAGAVLLGFLGFNLFAARPHAQGTRAYRALEEWQRQVRFEFSSDGVRHRNERSATELEWSLIAGWRETDDAFYLQQPGRQFLIVPKRAFATRDEVASVRALLTRHVRTVPPAPPLSRGPVRALLVWAVLVTVCVVAYAVLAADR